MKNIIFLFISILYVQGYGQVLNNKDSIAFIKETVKKKLKTHPKLEKKEYWKLDTVIVSELYLLTRQPESNQNAENMEHPDEHNHEMNVQEYITYIHYNIVEKMRMILVGRAENFKYPGEGVALIEKMLVD
jgi:hypothetical protein